MEWDLAVVWPIWGPGLSHGFREERQELMVFLGFIVCQVELFHFFLWFEGSVDLVERERENCELFLVGCLVE